MRFKFLKVNVLLPLSLMFSLPALAGVQITTEAPDNSAAEPSDTANIVLVVEANGNQGAVSVNLNVNQSAATADFPADFTLSFPSTCPQDGGAENITLDDSVVDGDTFQVTLDEFDTGGGGGAIGGSATYRCTITVNPVDDAIDEDSETFNLTLTGSASVVKSPTVQSYSLGDNDTAGIIVTDNQYSGGTPTLTQKSTSESGTTDSFFVELASQPLSNVTVDLAVDDTTEALISAGGGDMAALTLTFTPGNWDDGQEVTITGQDDVLIDGNIQYEITVVTTDETDDKYDGLAGSTVVGINTDNEVPGTLQYTTLSTNTSEGSNITVEVQRMAGTSGAVTVDYAFTNNGSTSNADYTDTTAGAGTLSWADGEGGTKSISITIVDDNLLEPDPESFTITLSDPTGGATLLPPTDHTVTIAASDPVTISISAPTPDPVPEGDAGSTAVSWTVTRSGGEGSAVSITWSTVDGTATGGVDYDSVSGETIMFAVADTEETITTDVTGDTDPEGNETFTAQLSESLDGVSLAGGGSSVATIEDDDAPNEGTFSITDISPNPAQENAGMVTVTVTRAGGTDGEATIDYATSDGTATAGADYTDTSGSLMWGDGEGGGMTFDVPIINNDEDGESDETFNVTITPDASEVIGVGAGVVTIIGDPTVAFNPDGYMVSENAGSVTVTVVRENDDEADVEVDYATVDGTATDGDDYNAVAGTLTFGQGVFSQDIMIDILADADTSGPESFTVELSGCANCTILDSSTTVTISEGDVLPGSPGTLAFSPTSVSVNEAAGTVAVNVSRTGGTDGAVSIGWETHPSFGTATAGADYTASSGTLMWADGEGGNKQAIVPIINDSDPESTETFRVRFVANSETGTEGDPTVNTTPATVSILDDDSTDAGTFSVLDNSVQESAGQVMVTVTRNDGSDGAVSVNYATSDGTATAGADYTAANGTLNWADGDAAAKSFPVTIIDDAIIDPNETFTVTLSNPTGGATIADGTGTVTIFDNDGGGTFSINDVTVVETELQAILTVTRSNDNDTAAFVSWMTMDDTAVSPDDYGAAFGDLVWEQGDTSSERQIVISIEADGIPEPDEQFKVVLTSAIGQGVSITDDTGIVTITDPVPIPTLSQWSMLLLAIILFGMGVYAIPRRRRLR